nr:hypothetical protein CFP56_21176 [Quercus suber]
MSNKRLVSQTLACPRVCLGVFRGIGAENRPHPGRGMEAMMAHGIGERPAEGFNAGVGPEKPSLVDRSEGRGHCAIAHVCAFEHESLAMLTIISNRAPLPDQQMELRTIEG